MTLQHARDGAQDGLHGLLRTQLLRTATAHGAYWHPRRLSQNMSNIHVVHAARTKIQCAGAAPNASCARKAVRHNCKHELSSQTGAIMSVLVTGATGNIGGRVVEQLLARGQRPRVLVRDAERARKRFGERVDVQTGDLSNASQLRAAFEEVEAVFLVNTGPELAQRDALAAEVARDANVRRVVKLSAWGARASGRVTAVAAWHAEGERALRDSGIEATVIQPVGFMSNTLEWARTIHTQGVVRASTGEGRIAMIDPEDIAAVATTCLCDSRWSGRELPITGPHALSYAQMVESIGKAIDRPLRFEAITDEGAHKNLLGHGMSRELADALVFLWREVREGLVDRVTNNVEHVTGKPPRSFADWARANASAFY